MRWPRHTGREGATGRRGDEETEGRGRRRRAREALFGNGARFFRKQIMLSIYFNNLLGSLGGARCLRAKPRQGVERGRGRRRSGLVVAPPLLPVALRGAEIVPKAPVGFLDPAIRLLLLNVFCANYGDAGTRGRG